VPAGEISLREWRVPAKSPVRGSTLPRVVKGVGVAIVPAGSLDNDPGIRPAGHGFASAKASWFRITDDLPQFAGMPPVA
jgi:hypothetical protein